MQTYFPTRSDIEVCNNLVAVLCSHHTGYQHVATIHCVRLLTHAQYAIIAYVQAAHSAEV